MSILHTPFFTKLVGFILAPFIFIASLFNPAPAEAPAVPDTTLGASLSQGPAVFETSLLSAITSSATSLTLVANSVRGGSTLSGYNCFTIDEGRAEREDVCGTVSGTTVSSLVRGIDPITATTTNATLQFAHRRGAQVKITDFPLIQTMRNQLSGVDTISNRILYASGITPFNSGDLTDKEYVDSLAFASIITGANFPIANTLVWYNGSVLQSTSTNPLFIGALNATSTASSTFAGAIGIATSSPWAKITVASPGSILVSENKLATSTSMTIDWRQGNSQLVQTGTAATTIGFTGYLPGQQIKVIVCNPGASAGAITWTGVDWVGGSAPAQTTTANYCDVWSFLATQATSTSATSVKIFGAVTSAFQ